MASWEVAKENVAPAKRGRLVASLDRALVERSSVADHKVAALESRLQQSEEDPLGVWLEYAKYVEAAYPQDTAKALEVIERCARELKDDERYRNDERYVRVWLEYAAGLGRPGELFRYVHKRKIGLRAAAFWIAWAEAAEAEGKPKLAAQAYAKATEHDARPSWLIEGHRRAFEERQKHAPPQAERPQPRPPARPAPSTTAIFVDDDCRDPALIEEGGDEPDDDWPDFGTRIGRTKENARKPARWTEAAVGKRRPRQQAAEPVPIFIDDELRATQIRRSDKQRAAPHSMRV